MSSRSTSRSPRGEQPLDTDRVRRTLLPGGLRVVSEQVPGARSAAFGIWVGVGSRDEVPSVAGVSHFLEHLLFKGTRRRSALDIAEAFDAVGGETNAFTGKEYTCFYARVLDADLPLAVDVVSDLITSSRITSMDVESERGVVLEEIAMHDDDPGDIVGDALSAALYGDAPLGRPVLGTEESLEALTRESVAGYYRRRYTPPSLVVAAAGGVEHEQLVELVHDAFRDRLNDGDEPAPRRPTDRRVPTRAGVVVRTRPTEQAHLTLGLPALRREDPRRCALDVLETALGGGMSSRLFQEVRERRGLAYSVYSWTDLHADTGLLGLYAGCAPERTREVLGLCRAVLADVARDGLSDDEVRRAVGALRGGLVLGLEDTGSRMTRLGKSELVRGDVPPVEELLARYAAVTPDEVRALGAELLVVPPALGVIGPFEEEEVRSWL